MFHNWCTWSFLILEFRKTIAIWTHLKMAEARSLTYWGGKDHHLVICIHTNGHSVAHLFVIKHGPPDYQFIHNRIRSIVVKRITMLMEQLVVVGHCMKFKIQLLFFFFFWLFKAKYIWIYWAAHIRSH